jgi:hypothetical protein
LGAFGLQVIDQRDLLDRVEHFGDVNKAKLQLELKPEETA